MSISSRTTGIDRSISFRIPPASLSLQAASWASRRRRGLAAIHLLASWAVLVLGVLRFAGSALESRSARASQLHPATTTTLPTRSGQSAAGITGSWSVSKARACTPLARWSHPWLRAVLERLAQTSQSLGERMVSNLHLAPPPSTAPQTAR